MTASVEASGGIMHDMASLCLCVILGVAFFMGSCVDKALVESRALGSMASVRCFPLDRSWRRTSVVRYPRALYVWKDCMA